MLEACDVGEVKSVELNKTGGIGIVEETRLPDIGRGAGLAAIELLGASEISKIRSGGVPAASKSASLLSASSDPSTDLAEIVLKESPIFEDVADKEDGREVSVSTGVVFGKERRWTGMLVAEESCSL